MDSLINNFSSITTALATFLLVIVGIAQYSVIFSQRNQQRFALTESYRSRWQQNYINLSILIYLGSSVDSYYQLLNKKSILKYNKLVIDSDNKSPTTWALRSASDFFGLLSDLCIRVIQNQLYIRDVYPIIGSEFLRHGFPIRSLLEIDYCNHGVYPLSDDCELDVKHHQVRHEIQTWLACHDGIRRRCLIMIDLLWSEAARLGDLPPYELITAANSKITYGKTNRSRLSKEIKKINGIMSALINFKLVRQMKNSEYKRFFFFNGLNKDELKSKNIEWVDRYLK